MTRGWALLVILVGCNDGNLGPIDAGPLRDLASTDQAVNPADRDGDGLDDDVEGQLAIRYLPFLSLAAGDDCPVSGLAVRVTPAATSPFVMIRYAWLFDRECDNVAREGAGGSISLYVNPDLSAASGIIGMRAIAREGTGCQNISTCGQCLGQFTCASVQGGPMPAVWAGMDSHALYVDRVESCIQTNQCAATCTDASMSAAPPIVNVGEPGRPLINDLTTQGFITAANGWQSPTLMHYDPWSGLPFGAIAAVSDLLDGLAIDPPSCSP
jgi:hypothetical protein